MAADHVKVIGRHFLNGEWIELRLENGRISGNRTIEGPTQFQPLDDWIAPALWDIQTNGRWGISFSDPAITTEQVVAIVKAQASLGTARLCPTLITAPRTSFQAALRTIAKAAESDPAVERMMVGIHLEGPYLSEVDGYRGAHPLDSIRDPDWDEFQGFQEAAGGRIVLTTLAPERRGAIAFIAKAVQNGIKVAIGHTSANGEQIRQAVDAGATLSTHLGNGIASSLARHPNPIWEQAAADGLSASFIADGHHLDPSTLKVLIAAKTLNRTILVSDAGPLAGMPVGEYGPWSVDSSGKIVVTGTPYLAGSNQGLERGLNVLLQVTKASLGDAFRTVTTNPARLLGQKPPSLDVGESAKILVFRRPKMFAVKFRSVYLDGIKRPIDSDIF